MSEMFKDVSIMQALIEFKSPSGILRAQDDGSLVKIYKQESNGCFMFQVSLKCSLNPKSVYSAFEKWESQDR
jgi:hypothetical protein